VVDREKREFGAWWLWVLLLVVITVPVFFGLRSAGILTRTIVEREVFEHSFQYSEARKVEIATYEASLAELQALLDSGTLTEEMAAGVAAQMAAIRIQLRVARSRQ
jgi:hypothetical protein